MLPLNNINERVKWVNDNAQFVINSLDRKAIDKYILIQKKFEDCRVSKNEEFKTEFKTEFKNFYGMPVAHLGVNFENKFFEIFEDLAENKNVEINLKDVLIKLHQIKTLKGTNSVQFSFVTKMLHTIDNRKVIYDKMIRIVFNFSENQSPKIAHEKIENYLNLYTLIQQEYEEVLKNHLLQKPMKMFDMRFANIDIHDIKKLDFIYWFTGRFVNSEIEYFRIKTKKITAF